VLQENSKKIKPEQISKVTFCRFWVSERLYEKGSSNIYSMQITLNINIVYACDHSLEKNCYEIHQFYLSKLMVKEKAT
jgi:hypothetical protein